MKAITLKLTSAIAMDGELFRTGTVVEVSDAEAKNLLHRGKAVLATEHDAPPVAAPEPAEVEPEKKPEKPKAKPAPAA